MKSQMFVNLKQGICTPTYYSSFMMMNCCLHSREISVVATTCFSFTQSFINTPSSQLTTSYVKQKMLLCYITIIFRSKLTSFWVWMHWKAFLVFIALHLSLIAISWHRKNFYKTHHVSDFVSITSALKKVSTIFMSILVLGISIFYQLKSCFINLYTLNHSTLIVITMRTKTAA